MTLRCKPNELCVISRTTELTRAFSGLIVTTCRRFHDGDFGVSIENYSGPMWVVLFATPRPAYTGEGESSFPPNLGVWPDAWLRPIRDDGSFFDETMLWECGMPKWHTHETARLTTVREVMEQMAPIFKAMGDRYGR